MDYAMHTAKNLPIGSGVTEAACKTLWSNGFVVRVWLEGQGAKWFYLYVPWFSPKEDGNSFGINWSIRFPRLHIIDII